jgi:hypothetical protein
MKELLRTFVELPTADGILVILAAGAVVTAIVLIVSFVSFQLGRRYAERDKVLIGRNPRVWMSSSAEDQRANLARHGIEYL